MLLEKPKFLQTSSTGTMCHCQMLRTLWSDLWDLQHAQSNGTYLAQRCGSKGHGEDQGWGKRTLAQDKDQGQGASLFLLDHLQGLVLSTLCFVLRFLTPARVSTIYASLYQTSGSPPQSGPASLPAKSVYLDLRNSIQQMQNGLLTSYLRAIFSRGMREDPVARAWRDRGHGCGVRSSS